MMKQKMLARTMDTCANGASPHRTFRLCFLLFFLLGLMTIGRTASAQTIIVDGFPGDWPAVLASPTIQFKVHVVDQFNTNSNDDVYQGSSADNINIIPGWEWHLQGANDKTDIENAGAALIGHKVYFFGDRYSDGGTCAMSFWLFKNSVHKLPNGKFSAAHADGDLLLTCNFDGGGGIANRAVYRWQSGSLVAATGLGIAAANVVPNSVDTLAPWPYTPKNNSTPANTYGPPTFLEAFVDLDSVAARFGITLDSCFADFFISTRTSHTVSATLEDLATGLFGTAPDVTVANDTVCFGSPAVFTAVTLGGARPIQWSWNDTVSYGSDSTYTINPAVKDTFVTVIARGANGCRSGIDTGFLHVKPAPIVDTIFSRVHCNGESASGIAFSSGTPSVTFTWTSSANVGFGTSGTGSIGAYTAANNTSSPVVATVTVSATGLGCNGPGRTFNVTVNPTPTISAGSNVAICSGLSTTLTATGGSTYTWSPGTGLSATTGASVIASPTTTTTYTVTGTSAAGCTNTATVTVSVNTTPTISAGPDVTICSGLSTTLTATGGSTYEWSPATGLSATTGASVIASPTTTTTYTVTGTSGAGCSNTATVTVSVNPTPTISAGPDVTICSGLSTTLTATGGSTYEWSPATGLSATTGASVVASPTTTTTYTVTGTSAAGCSNTATVTVSVNPTPTISAGPDVTICSGLSTTLTATGGSTYEWSPATGLSATTGASVIASPTTTTTYTVTGTSAAGCSNTAMVTVSVNPTPTINAGPDVTICSGLSTTLTATGGSTYEWSPATGLSATTGASVIASPTTTTTYTVTGTLAAGCTNTATVTVSVNPTPTINAGPDVTICSGLSTTLTATGGSTYSWSPATGLSATTGASVVASPTTTTTYTVTGTSAAGCSNTAAVTVSVNPTPNISAGPDVTICRGLSTTLTATGGSTYEWSPATGLSATTGASVIASPTTTTTYTVTGTSAAGCTNTATVTVSVNPTPTISAGPDVTICRGLSTTLTATGGSTYEWSPATGLSATTGASVVASPTTTTTYTVTGTLAAGCTNTATVTVSVNPTPTISAGPDVTICSGLSTTLTATGGSTYSWSPAAGLSATTGASVIASPTTTTTYTVTGTSAAGCSNTAAVTVSVNPTPNISAGPDVTICRGLSTTLTATGGSTYEWSPATGLSATTGASVVASPTTTTTYTVTGTSGAGCTNTATVTVSVNPTPTISAGPDVTICRGLSTTLTATGGSTYEWSPATGLSATTGASVVASPTTTTTYTVTGTLAAGCTNTATVTVSVNPIPNVAAHGDSTYCKGITAPGLNFTGDVVGTTFSWTSSANVGFGASGTGNIPAYLTLNPGLTNLVATVIVTPSREGCVGAKDTFLITIRPAITVPSIANRTVCSDGSGALINITGGDVINIFTWSATTNVGFGTAGTGNIGAYTAINNPGPANIVATVTVTVAGAGGCAGSSRDFTVTIFSKPNVVARDTVVCAGTALNLIPLGTPAGGTWSGPGVSGNTFNTGTPGTYKIYYNVSNGAGCSGRDSAYICVTQCCVVYGTYTQGVWGSCYGTVCDGKTSCSGRKTPVQLINYLLMSGQITVGRPGRSVIIPTYAAATVNAVMPGGYGPNKLTYAGNVTISNVAGSIFAVNYLSGGKLKNSLLGEQIAMKLNIRMTPGLVNFPIIYTAGGDSYFQTFQANENCCKFTCGDMCPICFSIKKSVAKYLTKGGTQAANLNSLVNLADDLLGGVVTPGQNVGGYIVPSYADVAAALGTISSAFNYFRTFNGAYGCGAAKGAIVSTTTTGQPSLESLTRIYPNPTTGMFTIEIPAITKDGRVTVVDMNGRVVLSATMPANPYDQKLQLEMPDVSRGMYFIRIEVDGNAFAKKLMLE